MAVGTDPEFFNFSMSSSDTSSLNVSVRAPITSEQRSFRDYDTKCSPRKTVFHSGKILKQRSSSRHLFNKSLIAHLQQPEFLHKHSGLKKPYHKLSSLLSSQKMQDNDMGDGMENVYLEQKLRDYTNHGFDHTVLMEENILPNDIESAEKLNSQFNSPVDEVSSRSSKSPNSIEDLNKEIERLFLNNEKFGITSFIWDKEEKAEGRRAPIADMLDFCKEFTPNRIKKRRYALAIRNYNDSDSNDGISSPDDHSGCEEYPENTLIENLDPPIIVPVPGKSGIDRVQTMNISKPFSGSKLQLSEDSAFAPIKAVPRSQSTPPQNTIVV